MSGNKVERYADEQGRTCLFVNGRFVKGDEEYAHRIQEMKEMVRGNQ